MKTRLLIITNHEKYAIIIILAIVVLTYLTYNVFEPLYSHLIMGDLFPITNLYYQNWSHSLAADLFALSGMGMYVGGSIFLSLVTNTTTTTIFPGIIFFFASYLSIPLMIKLTYGIPKWRRVLYVYLTATQLSSMVIVYWTGFGN